MSLLEFHTSMRRVCKINIAFITQANSVIFYVFSINYLSDISIEFLRLFLYTQVTIPHNFYRDNGLIAVCS